MHQEKQSPDQDCDAQRKTGVSSCNASFQKGFLETKDTEGREKSETIQTPLCNPIICSVDTIVEWDASVSIGPGISLFSPQPTWSRGKGILLSYQKFPCFCCPDNKIPTGSRVGTRACAHPPCSAHHPLLPSRPRHSTGAEVQDHHRDDSRGAVGALLLPLRWLGDQLHSQGTAATLVALQGTPRHPESTQILNEFPITPFPKYPACVCHLCAAHHTPPDTASLHFPNSFCVNPYRPSKKCPPKKSSDGKKTLPALLRLVAPSFSFLSLLQ